MSSNYFQVQINKLLEEAFKGVKQICDEFLQQQNHRKRQQYKTQFNQYHSNSKISQQRQSKFQEIQMKGKKMVDKYMRKEQATKNMPKTNSSNNFSDINFKVKPPPSPYMLFFIEKKDLIKSQFPQMSSTQVTQAAGRVWNGLTRQQKLPYTQEYQRLKRQYYRELNILEQ